MTARSLVGDIAGTIEAAHALEESGRTPYAELARASRAIFDDIHRWPSRCCYTRARGPRGAPSSTIRGSLPWRGVPQSGAASESPPATHKVLSLQPKKRSTSCPRPPLGSNSYLRGLPAHPLFPSWRTSTMRGDEIDRAAEASPSGPSGRSSPLKSGSSKPSWVIRRKRGRSSIRSSNRHRPRRTPGEQLGMVRSLLSLRAGDFAAARRGMAGLRHGSLSTSMAFEARRMLIGGPGRGSDRTATRHSNPSVPGRLSRSANGPTFGPSMASCSAPLGRPAKPDHDSNSRPRSAPGSCQHARRRRHCSALRTLSPSARDLVRREASSSPVAMAGAVSDCSWRMDPTIGRREAATMLARIGEAEDIPLPAHSRSLPSRRPQLRPRDLSCAATCSARALSRISVEFVSRSAAGASKASTSGAKSWRFSASCSPSRGSHRPERRSLEALWPDQDPGSALNSLNQTVYFLRRVFEPDYRDETSPVYVGQDGETIWLDADLVDSRSRRCLEI